MAWGGGVSTRGGQGGFLGVSGGQVGVYQVDVYERNFPGRQDIMSKDSDVKFSAEETIWSPAHVTVLQKPKTQAGEHSTRALAQVLSWALAASLKAHRLTL